MDMQPVPATPVEMDTKGEGMIRQTTRVYFYDKERIDDQINYDLIHGNSMRIRMIEYSGGNHECFSSALVVFEEEVPV